MLDVGWGELMLIGVVALIVVGPKDLPKLFKTAGHFMGRARGMAREFQRSMEQAAEDGGLKDAADSFKGLDRLNLNAPASSARKYAESLVTGGEKTMRPPAAPKSPAPAAATVAAAAPVEPVVAPKEPDAP